MPETQTDTAPVSGTPLASMLSESNAAVKEAIGEARQNRQLLQGMATALPAQLQSSREREKADIAALGPIPQLSPEDMRSYLGKPPQPQPTSMFEQWGSPAMFLAMFGAAFTKMPLTNALNAGAAVMKAYQQRDFDAAHQAFEEWKNHNATAIKLLDIQSNAYANAIKAIRETSGEERKDAMGTLTAYAHAFNDKGVADALAANRSDIAIGMLADRQDRTEDLKAKNAILVQQGDAQVRLLSAVRTLGAAKQSGDPDAIKAATADVEAAQAEMERVNKIVAEGKAASKASTATESRAQAGQNAKITEARDKLEKVLNGETVEYGGYEITPGDLDAAGNAVISLLTGSPDKFKAINQMRKWAGTPVVRGTTSEPVPSFRKKADAGEAGADGGEETPTDAATAPAGAAPAPQKGGPPSPDAVAVPPAFGNQPDGTKLRKDGKVYEKKGAWLIPVSASAPETGAP